jgi:hypothetical protein
MVFSVQLSTTGMKPDRVVPLRETIGSKIDERKGTVNTAAAENPAGQRRIPSIRNAHSEGEFPSL